VPVLPLCELSDSAGKEMTELSFEPIIQQAWYLQIQDQIQSSKRLIDKMPIAAILEMYRERKFLCDTCGRGLGRIDFSLKDHIAHMINPSIIWSCEDCLIDDMKHNRIVASTEMTKQTY
jgi:hypothetical protein